MSDEGFYTIQIETDAGLFVSVESYTDFDAAAADASVVTESLAKGEFAVEVGS